MGVHPSSMFTLGSVARTEARRDLWLWAEPIIADYATAWYESAMFSKIASGILAKKHCRLWQSVIHDQPSAVPQAHEDLRRVSDKLGLEPGLTHDLNTAILEELVDIVLCRYRGSRQATKAFSLVLMSASSCLGARHAAL